MSKKETIKSAWEAHEADKGSYFVDFDSETNMWGVFGTESGFCYTLHHTEENARDYLKNKE
jgi:hypothetical protein